MDVTTFEQDLFELRPFAERLQKFIEVEHHFVTGSLVLALSSRFGSGKTTFFQMWKADLDKKAEHVPLVISLNAWESDYYGDPLFAIVSALVERLRETGKSPDSLVSAAKDVGWFITAVGGQIAQKLTGVDAVAAGELAEKKRAKRDGAAEMPKDTFSVYQGRKAAMKELKEAIKDLVASSKPRVLFLVDELDRCRPDYAIAYLETIKHIFDIQGAVFILAADRKQLENSAKMAFGGGLDFDEYYRKFVHREVSLPPISQTGYQRLAGAYLQHYLQREGLRHCFMTLDSHRVQNIIDLVGALRMTPRQLQEVFRLLGHLLATSDDKKGRLVWGIAVGSIAMAAFKVGRPEIFEQLGTQRLEPTAAATFLKELLGKEHLAWWFALFATGGGLMLKENEPLNELMKRAGLVSEAEESSVPMDAGQWGAGWGHFYRSRFAQIYEKINQISQYN